MMAELKLQLADMKVDPNYIPLEEIIPQLTNLQKRNTMTLETIYNSESSSYQLTDMETSLPKPLPESPELSKTMLPPPIPTPSPTSQDREDLYSVVSMVSCDSQTSSSQLPTQSHSLEDLIYMNVDITREALLPPIPPRTYKDLNANKADGICYVNLMFMQIPSQDSAGIPIAKFWFPQTG